MLPVNAEWGDLVDEVDVPHEHAPAAVTLEADFVQRLPGILAFVHGLPELLVLVRNHLSATPTPYWD